MDSDLAAAGIAAGVSIVIAVGTVSVAFLTTRATLKRDHERQLAEFKRTMTDRLYDRRVAVYPGLFAATTPFRNSILNGAADLDLHLRRALVDVDEWHSREGGLMLSPAAHARLLELRKAVRECLNRDSDATNLDDLKRNIWICKNNLRKAMRQDLLLMFDEDQ